MENALYLLGLATLILLLLLRLRRKALRRLRLRRHESVPIYSSGVDPVKDRFELHLHKRPDAD